jgi:hypothetical protein
MNADELIRLYPHLYHMAAKGSWPSIRAHGLLSTSALVDLWDVAPPAVRESLIGQRRPDIYLLTNTVLGTATVRDQKPINEVSLREALTDMSPHEWYVALNSRVFFFLQQERLSKLLNARSYKDQEHVVLKLDTASLVEAHGPEILLCRINSGFAQPHSKAFRGSDTFKSINDYPHPQRAHPRPRPPWDVAELCVPEAVKDISTHVVRVDRMQRDQTLEQLV